MRRPLISAPAEAWHPSDAVRPREPRVIHPSRGASDAAPEFLADAEPSEVPAGGKRSRGWVLHCCRAMGSAAEWLFGLLSLTIGLAVLATIPIVQFLSLGYLLAASGRVARSGRLRDGLSGVRTAARLGSIVLGTWLVLLPLRFAFDLSYSARLLSEDGQVAPGWRLGLCVLTIATVSHIAWACYRGGRLRSFAWPAPVRLMRRLRQRGVYADARDRLWNFGMSLRLASYFWLGLRGFLGAVVWLLVPVTMLVTASRLPTPLALLVGLLGAGLFAAVLTYLPFLQTNFALNNRMQAIFQIRRVRAEFQRAPVAFWVALLVTLSFALPLYLLKAELIPREAAWLPSLVFIVFIAPARLLTGWAVGRANRRQQPRHFIMRWLAGTAAVPVVGMYVLIVYFTQYISWYGSWSLYEQHAFLVPVPFLGM